jgi:hypothetical protein
MKKIFIILFLVFTTNSFSYVIEKCENEVSQVNCLNVANDVYDEMFHYGSYLMASRAADAAYDDCVEQGGYAGDSVVTLEAN